MAGQSHRQNRQSQEKKHLKEKKHYIYRLKKSISGKNTICNKQIPPLSLIASVCTTKSDRWQVSHRQHWQSQEKAF